MEDDYTYINVKSKKPKKRFEGIVAAAVQKKMGLNPGKVDYEITKDKGVYTIGVHKRYAKDLKVWKAFTDYIKDLA